MYQLLWMVVERLSGSVRTFGFVNGPREAVIGASAPDNVEEDVGYFVDMMLSVDKEKFEKYWGSYSMVMKKYHILYDVIVNEMGVEL